MKSLSSTLFLIVALAARARAAATEPLADGEQLTYGVSFAIIPGAGRITVTAHSSTDSEGRPFLRVITETETRGLARVLLPFNARAESLYDVTSGHLVWFGESSSTRGKDANHSIDFDYVNSTAEYSDSAKSEDPRTIELPPPGQPSDLINCLLLARYWNLVPGQARDVLVFFEDDFYPLTIHALRYEDVDTGLGSSRALLLEPRMEKVPPKGMFKRGQTVKVWIGQDARRLPLQFEVELKVGSGMATLSAYHPAAAGAGAKAAPAPAGQK